MKALTTKLFGDDAGSLVKKLRENGINAGSRHSGTIPSFWWILVPEKQYEVARKLI